MIPTARTPALPDGIGKTFSLYKLGVLTPFAFGEGRQVISEREVNGLSSTYGELAGGPDVWLNTFRGKERSVLAELTTCWSRRSTWVSPQAKRPFIRGGVGAEVSAANGARERSTTFGDHLSGRIGRWLVAG